jgi:hypothetical protein
MELSTLKTKTRGRNSREIEYQGIGKQAEDGSVETAGVVTSIEDAIALAGGNLQSVLDNFAIGFNYAARQSVLDTDEFAGMLDSIDWKAAAEKAGLKDDDKGSAIEKSQDAFKRSVRAIVKSSGMELEDAATFLATKLPQVAKA